MEGNLSQLTRDLGATFPAKRRSALEALRNMGPEAASAAQAVVRALRDPDCGVREAAAFALAEISPDASVVADPLITTLTDKEEGVRINAFWALVQLGEAALPYLRKAATTEAVQVGLAIQKK